MKVSLKEIGKLTLEEVKEICAKHNKDCKGCILLEMRPTPYYHSCKLTDDPENWDLTTTSKFTQEEMELAASIATLYGSYDRDTLRIDKDYEGRIRLYEDNTYITMFNPDLFPSIEEGKSVKLKDILGG
jgi:hypothetical protein